MSNPETVTAELFDLDGTLLGSVDLGDASNLEFYDTMNEPGTGSLTFPLADADAGELTPGRYVNIKVDGTSRFTFKIEGNPQYRAIQRGGQSEQVVTVQGRGWGCVFDEAVIYPNPDDLTLRLDHSWRLYSFASPNFPNTGSWVSATQVHDWLDGASDPWVTCYFHAQVADDGFTYPSPINFPWAVAPGNYDPVNPPGAGYQSSYWIRPGASVSPDYRDTGYLFFRKQITLANAKVLTFDVTGDNYWTFFIEGVPVLGENADHFIWKGWKSVSIELPAGSYQLAAVVENVPHPEPVTYPACSLEGFAGGDETDNPAGFLMAAYTGAESPDELVVTSDSSWSSWFSNTRWPGWTPGQIIADFVNDAVLRGSLAVYDSDTFTDTLDSDGLAWRPLQTTLDTEYLSIAFDVGSTAMEALQQMYEEGWINWHVRPGTMILDVWRGREPTPSSSATFTAASNIKSLVRAETEKYANALLVQWEGGYVAVEDTAAITAHGTRVEDIWGSDAPTESEAQEQGKHELLRRAQEGYPAIVMEIEPTGTGDVPYVDFDLLDWVTIPAVGGGTELVRVLSIKCTQDTEGHAQWTLELNRKLRVQQVEQIELLRQIGGRSQVVRGRVQ